MPILPKLKSFSSSTDAYLYLLSLGYNKNTASSLIESFKSSGSMGTHVSVDLLKKFGKDGIKRLAEAIAREEIEKSQLGSKIDVPLYIIPPGSKTKVQFVAKDGENLQQLASRNSSLSALIVCSCGGIASCSTCHVILSKNDYKKLPPPDDDEKDMLDLALGVTPTSRLGCQIKLNPSCSGITFVLPKEYHDLF